MRRFKSPPASRAGALGPATPRNKKPRNLAAPGPPDASSLAGCRGLEPLSSGVTVDSKWMAGARSGSQDAGNTGSALERSSPYSQRFAVVLRPFETSLVQAGPLDGESVQWLSVREFAAMLRVSASTVYQVAAGEIPHVRVNNAIRIPFRR